MKPPLFILLIIMPAFLMAQTYTVKQDATGDYTTIQGAIDSLPGNDTILVWPGIYYENIEVKHKQFVLGSLTLTTGNNSYTTQTIIDGNFQGRCLYVDSCSFFEINGLTLQHGESWASAGIWVFNSNCNIRNCIVKTNFAKSDAGGIGITISNVYLSNTSIHHNKARGAGGGVTISLNSNVVFDSINRCSIYINYASCGMDFYKVGEIPVALYLDTLTVDYLDNYYILSQEIPFWTPLNDIALYVNNAYLQSNGSDLYVSPNGKNDNPGTSPNAPLKNIGYALLKANPDSIIGQTIFLLPGIYSDSMNNEWYPLGFKSHITIMGSGVDTTILDAENIVYHFHGSSLTKNYSIKNMTLINGNADSIAQNMETGSIAIYLNSNAVFEDLLFKHNQAQVISAVNSRECDNISLNNCSITDSKGGYFGFTSYWDENNPYCYTNSHINLLNCTLENNVPDPENEYGWASGRAFLTTGTYHDTMSMNIVGCLFAGNKDSTIQNYSVRGNLSLNDVTANIINCTFANNIAVNSQTGASFNIGNDSKVKIYNSLFYKNEPLEIGLYKDYYPPYATPDVHIYNSLVWGGESG